MYCYMETRSKLQRINEGQGGKEFKFFELKTGSNSHSEIIGMEYNEIVLYYVQNPKRSHQGWIYCVMPEELELMVTKIAEFSEGQFEVFQEKCRFCAQCLKDGLDLRFDRNGIVAIENHWEMWKSVMIMDYGTDLQKCFFEVAVEFYESFTLMWDEIDLWDGFSGADILKAGMLDILKGYKRIRKYLGVANFIESIM